LRSRSRATPTTNPRTHKNTLNSAREYNPKATLPDKTKKKKKKRKAPGAGAFARLSRNPAAALTADMDEDEDEDGGGTDIKVVAKDTGVRFSDIAGMQGLVAEMRVLVKCLLGDPAYLRVGAKAPKVRRGRGVVVGGVGRRRRRERALFSRSPLFSSVPSVALCRRLPRDMAFRQGAPLAPCPALFCRPGADH